MDADFNESEIRSDVFNFTESEIRDDVFISCATCPWAPWPSLPFYQQFLNLIRDDLIAMLNS